MVPRLCPFLGDSVISSWGKTWLDFQILWSFHTNTHEPGLVSAGDWQIFSFPRKWKERLVEKFEFMNHPIHMEALGIFTTFYNLQKPSRTDAKCLTAPKTNIEPDKSPRPAYPKPSMFGLNVTFEGCRCKSLLTLNMDVLTRSTVFGFRKFLRSYDGSHDILLTLQSAEISLFFVWGTEKTHWVVQGESISVLWCWSRMSCDCQPVGEPEFHPYPFWRTDGWMRWMEGKCLRWWFFFPWKKKDHHFHLSSKVFLRSFGVER